MQPRGNCRVLRGRGVDGIVCHFIGFARGCRSNAAALGVDVEGRWGDGAEGWTLRSPRDRSVPFALGCRRDWKALTRYKVSIARSVGGQRKRRCVLVEWLHGLRDGYALDKGIGRFLYKGFLCPLSKIPGLPLRVVCLSVCLSCGPSSAGCLFVCLSVVWAFLCGLFVCLSVVWAFLCGLFVCLSVVWAFFSGRVVVVGAFLSGLFICVPVVWASLRARCCGPVGGPSFSRALVSGLVTMSSIAMNRMGLKLVLFVSLLDSDRACCYPGCPL